MPISRNLPKEQQPKEGKENLVAEAQQRSGVYGIPPQAKLGREGTQGMSEGMHV